MDLEFRVLRGLRREQRQLFQKCATESAWMVGAKEKLIQILVKDQKDDFIKRNNHNESFTVGERDLVQFQI